MNLRRYRWPLLVGFIVLGASMYLYADRTSDSSDGFVKIWEKSVESEDYFFTLETGSLSVDPEKTPILRVSNDVGTHMQVAVYRQMDDSYRILGKDPGIDLEFRIPMSSSLSLMFNGTVDTDTNVNIMIGHLDPVDPLAYYMNGSILKPIGIGVIIIGVASTIFLHIKTSEKQDIPVEQKVL